MKNVSSSKWDGHDVEIDGEWLESLYETSELLYTRKTAQPAMARKREADT